MSGTGFLSGTVAPWDGAVRPTTVLNATTLLVSIPASDLPSAGTAQVQARYGMAADSVSNALLFTILAPTQPTPTSTPTATPSPSPTLAPGEPTLTPSPSPTLAPSPSPTLAPGQPTFTPSPTATIPPGDTISNRLPALFLNQPLD